MYREKGAGCMFAYCIVLSGPVVCMAHCNIREAQGPSQETSEQMLTYSREMIILWHLFTCKQQEKYDLITSEVPI